MDEAEQRGRDQVRWHKNLSFTVRSGYSIHCSLMINGGAADAVLDAAPLFDLSFDLSPL